MYTLLRSLTLQQLFIEQLPAVAISFIIAEILYKFHSFTLETVAFLITWFVVDAVIQWITRMVRSRTGEVTAR